MPLLRPFYLSFCICLSMPYYTSFLMAFGFMGIRFEISETSEGDEAGLPIVLEFNIVGRLVVLVAERADVPCAICTVDLYNMRTIFRLLTAIEGRTSRLYGAILCLHPFSKSDVTIELAFASCYVMNFHFSFLRG